MAMKKRMTRDQFEQSFGALNPVGHVVIAFDSDAVAADARAALLEGGAVDDDIYVFTSAELEPRLSAMLRNASGTAGFGYEVTLMRRYLALMQENAGWLVVHAPSDAEAERVGEVARRFHAKSAVRYHTMASEELV
jgi:hypothetical protein